MQFSSQAKRVYYILFIACHFIILSASKIFSSNCKKSRFIFFNKAGYISCLYDKLIKSRVHNRHKAMVKQSTKHVQLVLQQCCETIWIAMFTYYHPHLDLSLQQIRLQVFFLGCKNRNIAIQLHLQQSCKTSCTFFIPVLQYLNKNCKHKLSSELFGGKNMILPNEAKVHEST